MDSVLVMNCGSSSVKFALYTSPSEAHPALTALAERLNEPGSQITLRGALGQTEKLGDQASHRDAMRAFLNIADPLLGGLRGIGHRVVHGGEHFRSSMVVSPSMLQQLQPLSELAPLHNPVNLQGIELCQELFPELPQVAVFDTSFHQTMPESTYLYGVPYDWYEQHGVRRYGFHGTSYRYVTRAASALLGKPAEDTNLLIAHLGNGCSAAAIRCGQSVDCSMGFSPLEGLVMGSRCGDIDPGLIEHMQRSRGLSLHEMMRELNRNSGLKGLSGLSNDMRTLLQAEAEGHAGAARAIAVFCFRVARHFAALSASLPAIDAVVFTGGIGEHAPLIRQRILAAWRHLNFRIDPDLNQQHGDAHGRITQPGSPLAMVVATDEERMIALDTYELTEARA